MSCENVSVLNQREQPGTLTKVQKGIKGTAYNNLKELRSKQQQTHRTENIVFS